ncbi:MAG: hypothetical protein ABFD89_06725 [Bryobacteraceae bacterium]
MKDKSNTESAPAVDRAFLNIIAAHRGGNIITEVSAAMKQVTAAVQLTGKGGSVTLTMDISPASKGDAGTLVFLPKVKANVPEAEAVGSIFYADADFNLVREDPNQQRLDLKVVEPRKAAGGTPLKKVEAKPEAE